MYGYANFEGPSKNDVIFRHGVAITHPRRSGSSPRWQPRRAHHHLDYVYDTRQNFLKLVVSENGTVLATSTARPTPT
jgi:hypothetical protein